MRCSEAALVKFGTKEYRWFTANCQWQYTIASYHCIHLIF